MITAAQREKAHAVFIALPPAASIFVTGACAACSYNLQLTPLSESLLCKHLYANVSTAFYFAATEHLMCWIS